MTTRMTNIGNMTVMQYASLHLRAKPPVRNGRVAIEGRVVKLPPKSSIDWFRRMRSVYAFLFPTL